MAAERRLRTSCRGRDAGGDEHRGHAASRGHEVAGLASRLGPALALARESRFDAAMLDVNLAGEPSFPVADLLAESRNPLPVRHRYGRAWDRGEVSRLSYSASLSGRAEAGGGAGGALLPAAKPVVGDHA